MRRSPPKETDMRLLHHRSHGNNDHDHTTADAGRKDGKEEKKDGEKQRPLFALEGWDSEDDRNSAIVLMIVAISMLLLASA